MAAPAPPRCLLPPVSLDCVLLAVRRLRAVLPMLLLLAAACTEATTPLTAPEVSSYALDDADRGSRCVEGCLDVDPDPNAVGYFLPGLENQFAHCADGDLDQDQDGLDDGCELALALAFAPQMSFAVGDEVRREPRWAAEWLDGDPGSYTVRIAYLQSYWMDMGDGGTSSSLCETLALAPPWAGFWTSLSTCNGHAGDSEWIRLDVKYNPTTQHWFLVGAKYSAHEWHVNFILQADSTLATLPEVFPTFSAIMEYPDKRGGFPRAYAADRKHANYPTRAFCDFHGGVKHGLNTGSDVCSLPRYLQRLEVPVVGNIGSRSHQFVNCVETQRLDHPNYGSSLQECYWSGWSIFKGWFNAGSGASAYGILLYDHFGF